MIADSSEQLHARIIGKVEWCCPVCYGLNRDTFGPRGPHTVRCNRKNCETHFMIGVLFHRIATGFKAPPCDVFMPSESDIELWRSGQPVNRLRLQENPSCSDNPTCSDPEET